MKENRKTKRIFAQMFLIVLYLPKLVQTTLRNSSCSCTVISVISSSKHSFRSFLFIHQLMFNGLAFCMRTSLATIKVLSVAKR